MRNVWMALACAVLPAAAAACGDASADAGASVARDSAGVRIVQSERPRWKDGEGWTVGETPSVDIGVVDGDAAYQLDEVYSVARLADGRVLVADGGTKQLRLYSAQGRHLRSMGREGGGPGEFTYLGWAGPGPADSLLAWDPQSKRLSVFAPDGRFVRTVTPTGLDRMFPQASGVLADGSLLVSGGVNLGGQMELKGEVRDTATYHRVARDGRSLGRLGPFPGWETFVFTSETNLLMESIPFGRNVFVRPAGGEVLVAQNDRYEARFLAPDGALRRIVRRTFQPVRVTDADWNAHFDEEDAREDGSSHAEGADLARLRARRREVLPRRETFPAFADARTDAEGNLWMEQYLRPGEEPPRWDVFDPEGHWLGTVETPSGLRIHQIGADWILGVEKDELEVEHVRMYPLAKAVRR